MACKDVMASYVKQLLELDEGRQRATLDSLSKYAEQRQTKGEALTGAGSTQQAAELPQLAKEVPQKVNCVFDPCSNRMTTDAKEPLTVERLYMEMGKNMKAAGVVLASTQLQQANPFLELSSPSRVATPPVMRPPMLTTEPLAADVGQDMNQRFKSVNENATSGRVAGFLEKALSDLSNSLTPEAATEAKKLLAGLAGQAHLDPNMNKVQDLEAMKWLTQHLEKQQEASVQKLVKLMAANQQGCSVPAGLDATGQPLLPPGLVGVGGGSAAVEPMVHAPYSWGGTDTQMQAPMYLPMPGGNPWWGSACQIVPPQYPHGDIASPGLARRAAAAPKPGLFAGGMGSQRRRNPVAATSGEALAASGPTSPPADGETLRMHLRSLIKIDSGRVLIVRKINRLGFASPQLLEEHYSWYGKVERVLVAHSRVKSGTLLAQAYMPPASRLRPSGLGFVVMSKIEEAEAILKAGPEQIVCGAVIRVQKFERRMSETGEGESTEEMSPDTNSSEDQQSS